MEQKLLLYDAGKFAGTIIINTEPEQDSLIELVTVYDESGKEINVVHVIGLNYGILISHEMYEAFDGRL